ncbi:uncharacterized protein BCR38DRAFT_486794 [Pseudomassariella vexata]|uniref:Uncharacterized protein n=1 Tax=Pseudomassariella vexata TaxID=1141098 RepID=A0A1Y2DTP8_9PEZI|nr:uncharacterized protein BCR38DRAFT_486794 [Pseudomassariella vexata]ORY62524.1 hypothetical protein BCR38DRAFT_486794 [Pseudomassariella vexata]
MSLINFFSNTWKKSKAERTGPEPGDNGFGFHTVIDRDADAPEMADIVAVHGLNGHYETTWTDEKTGVNWLRDCMTIKFAHVMSFSYNSAVQFSKSISDLFIFADQLLEGPLAARINIANIAIPIDSNHCTMCRFSHKNEPRFQTVMANLANLARDARKSMNSTPEIGTSLLMGDLSRSNWKQHKERNPPTVTLILQLLVQKVETGASRHGPDGLLESQDIDTIYLELLSTRPDAAEARKMLSIISVATRPLTIVEMSMALAVTPDHDAL